MSYITIKENVEETIIINKSEFIGHMRRCSSQEEAENILLELQTKYVDANHNCYAYIIGKDKLLKKCSDDGEPSQTAGVPILNVLEHNNVTDVICVVTRYFGGIKLGAGGLVRAYSKSCSTALDKCQLITKELGVLVEVIIDYRLDPKLDYYLSEKKYPIVAKEYFEKVNIQIEIPKDEYLEFSNYLTNLSNDNHIIEVIDDIYIDSPIK